MPEWLPENEKPAFWEPNRDLNYAGMAASKVYPLSRTVLKTLFPILGQS